MSNVLPDPTIYYVIIRRRRMLLWWYIQQQHHFLHLLCLNYIYKHILDVDSPLMRNLLALNIRCQATVHGTSHATHNKQYRDLLKYPSLCKMLTSITPRQLKALIDPVAALLSTLKRDGSPRQVNNSFAISNHYMLYFFLLFFGFYFAICIL